MARHGNTQNKKGLHFPLPKAFCPKIQQHQKMKMRISKLVIPMSNHPILISM
jgi:hypothetical protein